MAWKKIDEARKYAGGVSRRLMYSAVAKGELKAARIGAGRNLLFLDSWIDQWLEARAESLVPREISPPRLKRSA